MYLFYRDIIHKLATASRSQTVKLPEGTYWVLNEGDPALKLTGYVLDKSSFLDYITVP
jgi:hypothetical protein